MIMRRGRGSYYLTPHGGSLGCPSEESMQVPCLSCQWLRDVQAIRRQLSSRRKFLSRVTHKEKSIPTIS
jgi:hypothetical protein